MYIQKKKICQIFIEFFGSLNDKEKRKNLLTKESGLWELNWTIVLMGLDVV